MNRMIAIPLLIFCFSCFFCDEKEADNPAVRQKDLFEPAISAGIVNDAVLVEASGIIASKSNPDMFWIINDSGNDPAIYLINSTAELIHTYWLENLENRDWEDLTLYEDKASKNQKIVIGDIGDNFASRDFINLIVFDEPKFSSDQDTLIEDYEVFTLKYSEGPRDAETLLFDPIQEQLFVISKREENVGVFEVPKSLDTDTAELHHLGNLPFKNITSGDITFDGKEILLKSYDSIYYWDRNIANSLFIELENKHISINYKIEPQGESICWDTDVTGFYTLSERSWASQQVLYYYKKANDD